MSTNATEHASSVVGDERRVGIGRITLHRGRRRPSGDPGRSAPVPRAAMWAAGMVFGLLAGWGLAHWILGSAWHDFDSGLTRWITGLRTPALDSWAEALADLTARWLVRALLWGGVALLAVYRRWRRVFVAVAVVAAVDWVTSRVAEGLARPAPLEPAGAVHPSVPMAVLAATLVALVLSLVPPRHRRGPLVVVGLLLPLLAVARVYLGLEHAGDSLLGALFGAAAALAAVEAFAPADAFPVSYARSRPAHLPMTAKRTHLLATALKEQLLDDESPRATAMRRALLDQLGCEVVGCDVIEAAPFGLAGSAGSTPLRIRVAGRHDGEFFAKLYATTHLRSDRSYKLTRAILYGRLEDERPFTSVRRLAEYEDYMLQKMHLAGIPSPVPLGIVRIVPGREYLVITEFLAGAEEIDRVPVDENLARHGIDLVRRLWDADLAHRDLKPANLLVHEGRIRLIDVAFAEVRPSAWRKAVDLANMMLILSLHLGADTVYRLALETFTERDVAEAFAATRGLTIPSQLRSLLKRHRNATGTDLVDDFRSLAPECPPISIQRWSVRRLALAAGTIGSLITLSLLVYNNLRGVDLL